MNKLILLLAGSLFASAAGAQVAVQNLPSGSAISGGDYAICDQSAVTNKCTYTQVAAFSTGYITSQANTWSATQTMNISGTASGLSGTPALPNGTTATTQTTGDNTTKLATDAFVLANASSSGVASVAAGGGIAVTGTGSGPYTGAVTVSASYAIRAVTTGTTDTIASTDCANGVNYTSSSAVAITLPQATSSFAACSVDVINNSSQTETVTPTTSTINGGSSLAVPAGTSVNITALSGNYIAAGTGVGGLTHTIAKGTAALGTSAIAWGACATTVTVAATGVLTTDTINAAYASNPQSVTGYTVSASGWLSLDTYPTAGNINIQVCNGTAASITPAAMSVNWAVRR